MYYFTEILTLLEDFEIAWPKADSDDLSTQLKSNLESFIMFTGSKVQSI